MNLRRGFSYFKVLLLFAILLTSTVAIAPSVDAEWSGWDNCVTNYEGFNEINGMDSQATVRVFAQSTIDGDIALLMEHVASLNDGLSSSGGYGPAAPPDWDVCAALTQSPGGESDYTLALNIEELGISFADCTSSDSFHVFYDDNEQVCTTCGGYLWDASAPGELDIDENGNWDTVFQGSAGSCCGDDLTGAQVDDADWSASFCYACGAGNNSAGSGTTSRMWNEDESLSGGQSNYVNSRLCCGDDDNVGILATNDCGYIGNNNALCWKSERRWNADYSEIALGDQSSGITGNSDPQWYWTKPGNLKGEILSFNCDGANTNVDGSYLGQPVYFTSTTTDWAVCDRYTFSTGRTLGVNKALDASHMGVEVPIQIDFTEAGNKGSLLCSFAQPYSTNAIRSSNNNNNPASVTPYIYECSDDNIGAVGPSSTYMPSQNSNLPVPSGRSIPYFGLYNEGGMSGNFDGDFSIGKFSLQEYFKPNTDETIAEVGTIFDRFPRFSSIDAIAFVPQGYFSGGPLSTDCASKDCLIIHTGIATGSTHTIWTYNADGRIRNRPTTDIFPDLTSGIEAMTAIPSGSFGSNPSGNVIVGLSGNEWFEYSESGSGGSTTIGAGYDLDDILGCGINAEGSDKPLPANIDSLSFLQKNYFGNVYPRILMFDNSHQKIYQLEGTDTGTCPYITNDPLDTNSWNFNKNLQGGQNTFNNWVDSFEALPITDGSARFYLPVRSTGILASKENDLYMFLSTPKHCLTDTFSSDLDTTDPSAASLCSSSYQSTTSGSQIWSIGPSKYDDESSEYCCGEAEDYLESFVADNGVCLKGQWFDSQAGEGQTAGLITETVADDFINSHTQYSSTGGELKELLVMDWGATGEVMGCAINTSKENICPAGVVDCEEKIARMGVDTKPYQGSSNLLYSWDFRAANILSWELVGFTQGDFSPGIPSYLHMNVDSTPTQRFRHYIHKIEPSNTYNFKFEFKGNDQAIGKKFNVYYGVKGPSDAMVNTFKRNQTFTILSKDWQSANLVFKTDAALWNTGEFNLAQNHHYIGIEFESSGTDYGFDFVNVSLSNNDYLLDLKDDVNSHDHASAATPLINDKGYCSLVDINNDNDYDYYCGFNEVWNPLPLESNITAVNFTLKFLPEEDWWDIRGKNGLVSPSVQIAGCCDVNECWNGDVCVPSDYNDTHPVMYPNISSRVGYRCVGGDWTWQEPKWDWDDNDERYGYCPSDSQCLVDYLGSGDLNNQPGEYSQTDKYANSEEVFGGRTNNPMCIDDGQYIQDHYCDNGEWRTRTSFLIDKMLSFVDDGDTFTFYCDSFDSTHNFKDYNTSSLTFVTHNEAADCAKTYLAPFNSEFNVANAYIYNKFDGETIPECLPKSYYSEPTYTSETMEERGYSTVNKFCYLSIKNTNNNRWETIIGTTLNQPVDAVNYPFINLIGGADSCTPANPSDTYIDTCQANFFNTIYNPEKKIFIFWPKEYGSGIVYDLSIIADFRDRLLTEFRSFFWRSDREELMPIISAPSPIEINDAQEIKSFYLADYPEGGEGPDVSIKGGVFVSGFRNKANEDPNSTKIEDRVTIPIYSNSYLFFKEEELNDPALCNTILNLSQPKGYWSDLHDSCIMNVTQNTNDYGTVISSHRQKEVDNFYEHVWSRITGRLRPGR